MFSEKIIRLALIFSFIVIIFHGSCGKTPTSPDVEDVTNPAIWVNVSSMSFTATIGGTNPSSKTLQVKNTSAGTLNYTISDDADWLSVSPTGGSSTDSINEHTVSADISGLSEGNYSGTISITDSNAANSPQTASVTLKISGPPADNEISISCDPSSGGTGTIVTIPVKIKGNIQEIKAFGLELTYDTTMFEYQSVSKGDLTGDWTAVDGNKISSGSARIGGFAGAADPIPKGSNEIIAIVKLKVTCSGCYSGQQSQICIQNYTDDIGGMTSDPSCTTFTYNK